MAAGAAAAARRGRPRDPEVDRSIHAATISLLVEQGYARTTIEAVAERAGVAHTTVYRRWPSKAHLVHEAVFPASDAFDAPRDATFAETIYQLADGLLASLSRPAARAALPGLLADCMHDEMLRRRITERFEPDTKAALRAAADRGAASGECRDDIDVDLLFMTLLGTAMALAGRTSRRSSAHLARSLCTMLLDGLKAHRSSKGVR